MLALYHFGDAICAKKVRLALGEKGVAWKSRDCSGARLRDPDYLKLNPNGVVPTLVHDDAVLTESRIISEYIDDAFEGPALTPSVPLLRHRARRWTKQIDDSLHLNVFILTFLGCLRGKFLGLPPELRAAALPGLRDPLKRAIASDLVEQGWSSPWAPMAAARFDRLLTEMQLSLAQSPYLAGPSYSLADADYTAYLNRLADLGFDGLWADKPAVADWWVRMKQRPSYKTAIIDWETAEDVERYKVSRRSHADELGRLVATAVVGLEDRR